tara:strand:+ start:2646 stop:3626 length:981 start_codon:yes stop_codon:yes gene_type:complete
MAKEILLYSEIYSYSAVDFINQMNDADGKDITLRINSPGGDVLDSYGMIAKFAEYQGNKKIKVDGKAYSMAAFFLAYADEVEALDVSEILIHRAAYPTWYEAREDFKDSDDYKALVSTNKSLRTALENKIDTEAFDKISKYSLDEIFSMESRLDSNLTSKQALKIGLISKVNKLTSKMSAEIEGHVKMTAQKFSGTETKTELNNKPNKSNKMTANELKANHPGVYSEVLALGSESGIKAERDRVGAWLAFVDADTETVVAGVKDGESLSQTAMAELSRKAFSVANLKTIEANSEEAVVIEGTTIKDNSKDPMKAFNNELDTILKAK